MTKSRETWGQVSWDGGKSQGKSLGTWGKSHETWGNVLDTEPSLTSSSSPVNGDEWVALRPTLGVYMVVHIVSIVTWHKLCALCTSQKRSLQTCERNARPSAMKS